MKKLILFTLLLSLIGLVSANGDNYFMGGMMTGMYGGFGMFFGWLTGILIIAVLVLLIAWLIKQIQKK